MQSYSVNILKEKTCNVLVTGAGTAGVFAAISAARAGARVVLCEKGSMPGGTGTVCGVDYPGIFHAWGKQIIDGPCYESIKRAEALGGAEIPEVVYQPKKHWMMQVRYNVFIYVHVLEQMLAESGVEIMYHSMPVSVNETACGAETVLACKEGCVLVKSAAVIDATGDANAVSLAGFKTVKSEILQPATLINNLGGYDYAALDKNEVSSVFAKAFEKGELTLKDTQGRGGNDILREHRIHCHIHTSSPETSEGKSVLETEARNTVYRVLEVCKRIKGVENINVESFFSECGVRESVRIDAETNVRSDDYVSGKVFDDAVCYAFYPVDLHTDHAIKQIFLEKEVVPTVPYSALIPKGSKYILACGRCVGSDTDANSALRVQAPCMAMGQAAGVAAAIMAKNKSDWHIDFDELCKGLRQIGAIVPAAFG